MCAFGSFSAWAVTFGIIAYCAAFFWRRRSHEDMLSVSFWLFASILALGGFLIQRETDFFEYFGALQALAVLITFVVFLLAVSASSAPKKFSVAETAVHTSLLLLWTMLSGMLLDRWGALWYLGFFAGVALLAREILELSLAERGTRIVSYAFFSALLASQLLYALRFLPFHLIPQAILVSVSLIVFFDLVRAHMKGELRRAFAVEKVITFLFFLLMLAFFSKWGL